MSRLPGLFVLLIVTSLALGPGLAVATEDPRFETTVSEQYVTPGQTQTITVTLVNDAEEPDDTVERTTNVRASLEAGNSPFTVTSGPVHLGTVEDGVPTTMQFGIDVPQDVAAGTYTLPIDVTYEYEGDERETTTTHVQAIVSDRARFAIVDTESDLHVQSTGSMTVTVQNVGSEPVTDATLKMESRSSVMAFEGDRSGVRALDGLAPGENRTVTYAMSATDVAEPDTYPVVGTVRYDDEEQVRRSSRPLAATVSVTREQTFAITEAETALRVDREGTMTVEVENTGPRAVANANIRIDTAGTGLHPTQTAVAVGDLNPGESALATYEISVDDDTTATTRQILAQLEYDDINGEHRMADPERLAVDIEPDYPVFTLEPVENRVPAGETVTVEFEVTNNEPVTLSSINAKAFTDAPVSIPDDSAFIGELEPGESTVITMQVSAPGTAPVKEYPISLDFQYDDPDGDTKLSDTYDQPVSVLEGTTLRDQLSDLIGTFHISTHLLWGGAVGIGISGIGIGTLLAYRRHRNDG